MKNNEFEMMLNDYMDGYDEGKNDDIVTEEVVHKSKGEKNIVLLRRKKGHWKSQKRIAQLTSKSDYQVTRKSGKVLAGMLRSHQISEISHLKTENHFDRSIGNQKRTDAANLKLREANSVSDNSYIEMA